MTQRGIVDRFKTAQDSLVIQQSDFSLAAIFQMVSAHSIDITPHYQRRDRWSVEKQSALIESFLLNVPVPPVYLSEDEYGRYSVIDGKQRITAVCQFLGGEFRLRELEKFPELNGLYFESLPSPLQNALSIRPYIRVTTLLKQSNSELKYEVFLRLNTGGESLKAQEVRNVAYSGPFNDLLFELSREPFLRRSMKITSDKSAAFKSMDDLEHVLRFFTLDKHWQDMGHVLRSEMDSVMAQYRYSFPESLSTLFKRSLQGCEQIWATRAFKKPTNSGWREQFISPLYDAEMIAVSLLRDRDLRVAVDRRERVVRATQRLFASDPDFVKSVTQSTNNPSAVRRRIDTLHEILLQVVRS